MKKNRKRIILEYTEAIITALILALFIRAFVVQAFKIPTGSMVETLMIGDHILVNKFIYGVKIPFTDKKILEYNKPVKGDIIVFEYPVDPDRDFIKRVIGTEGDVIEGIDKTLYVNGIKAVEPYVIHSDSQTRPAGTDPRDSFGPIVVPRGKVFMMGDNRDYSYDSRFWGAVDQGAVKGKALIVYWSWDGEKHMPRLTRMGRVVR